MNLACLISAKNPPPPPPSPGQPIDETWGDETMPWINVDLCSSDIHQFYLISGKQPAPDLLSCELSLETFLLTWIGMLFVKIISGGLAYAIRRARPAQWAVTILESLIHTAPQGPAVLKNITSPHYLLVWCVCVGRDGRHIYLWIHISDVQRERGGVIRGVCSLREGDDHGIPVLT